MAREMKAHRDDLHDSERPVTATPSGKQESAGSASLSADNASLISKRTEVSSDAAKHNEQKQGDSNRVPHRAKDFCNTKPRDMAQLQPIAAQMDSNQGGQNWEDFGISSELANAARQTGWQAPLPEQKAILKATSEKRETVSWSGQGTGKSVACAIIAVDIALRENLNTRKHSTERYARYMKLVKQGKREAAKNLAVAHHRKACSLLYPSVVILAPTRLLGDRMMEQVKKLLRVGGFKLAVDFQHHEKPLPSPVCGNWPAAFPTDNAGIYLPCDIMVSTVGRLMDMKDRQLSLSSVKLIVLDDVQMLNKPYLDDTSFYKIIELLAQIQVASHQDCYTLGAGEDVDLRTDSKSDEQLMIEATPAASFKRAPYAWQVGSSLLFVDVDSLEPTTELTYQCKQNFPRFGGLVFALRYSGLRAWPNKCDRRFVIAIKTKKQVRDMSSAVMWFLSRLECEDLRSFVRAIEEEDGGEDTMNQFNDAAGKCRVLIVTQAFLTSTARFECRPIVICYDIDFDIDAWVSLKERPDLDKIATLLDSESSIDRNFIKDLVLYLNNAGLDIPEFMINVYEEDAESGD